MKCGKWICPILLALMLIIAGNVYSGDTFKSLLQNAIVQYYNLNDYDIEIDIRTSRIDFESITCDSLSIEPLTRSKPRGLLSFKVDIFNQGEKIGSEQARVKIAYFDNVLVTTDRIGRHKPLSPENTEIRRMEITSLTSEPLTSDEGLADLWTKRDIRKDQILSSKSVEKIPTVLSGQGVSILYKSKTLEISSNGTAMESGYIGDKIRIKNESSNKIVTATVINGETVGVEIN